MSVDEDEAAYRAWLAEEAKWRCPGFGETEGKCEEVAGKQARSPRYIKRRNGLPWRCWRCHLQALKLRVRTVSDAAVNAKMSRRTCRKGHPFAEGKVRTYSGGNQARICLRCKSENRKARRDAKASP